VKKWLKSVYVYGSYREIKTGVSLFLDHSVHTHKQNSTLSDNKGPLKLSAREPINGVPL